MSAHVRIPTILGELIACESQCSDYPGIHIFLRREGVDLLLASVEVEHVFPEASVNYTIYGNTTSDEPTISDRIFADELDEGFDSLTES